MTEEERQWCKNMPWVVSPTDRMEAHISVWEHVYQAFKSRLIDESFERLVDI